MKYFISYTSDDRDWAAWIAWVLEEAGHVVAIQAWDFRPGNNFVLGMQDAANSSDKTILVLSSAFLASPFAAAEWAAEFVDDPMGVRRRLIPVRVAECRPTGLLAAIVYIDLVGMTKDEAVTALIDGLAVGRAKPATEPSFPGSTISVGPTEPDDSVDALTGEEISWLRQPASSTDSLESLLHLKPPIAPEVIIERWVSTEPSRLRVLIGRDAFGRPMEIDLLGDGPLGHVLGNSGAGTTSTLESMAMYTALSFPPSRIRLHLSAAEGHVTWHGFAGLPHATLHTTDDVPGGLLDRLESLIHTKALEVTQHAAVDIGRYNETHSESPLPIDLVLIDELRESSAWMDRFLKLVRVGRSLGVAAIAGLPSARFVTTALTLDSRFAIVLGTPELPSDYLSRYSALGVREFLSSPGRPLSPGRGFLLRSATGAVPLQSAAISERLYTFRDSPRAEVARLEELIRAIRIAADLRP